MSCKTRGRVKAQQTVVCKSDLAFGVEAEVRVVSWRLIEESPRASVGKSSVDSVLGSIVEVVILGGEIRDSTN